MPRYSQKNNYEDPEMFSTEKYNEMYDRTFNFPRSQFTPFKKLEDLAIQADYDLGSARTGRHSLNDVVAHCYGNKSSIRSFYEQSMHAQKKLAKEIINSEAKITDWVNNADIPKDKKEDFAFLLNQLKNTFELVCLCEDEINDSKHEFGNFDNLLKNSIILTEKGLSINDPLRTKYLLEKNLNALLHRIMDILKKSIPENLLLKY